MAEGVFRDITQFPNHPLISNIDSAGTGAYHAGDEPDHRTTLTLKSHGITDYHHAARKLTAADYEEFDYLLAMDDSNFSDMMGLRQRLESKRPDSEKPLGKVVLFGDFGGEKGEVVVDPYYGGRKGFEVAYKQMIRFSDGFLKHLQST